jgi:cytochrome c biogenesis protein CcmG, thiol:disulfide interchange protein DsbE
LSDPPAGGSRPSRGFRSLPRRTRTIVGASTIATIVTLGVLYGLNLALPPKVPDDKVVDVGPAPAFSLPSVSGGQAAVELASLKGHPVVLNFWGSWCVPCRGELPILAAAARAEGKRVRFVGVDLEDTRSGAQAMLQRYHVPYPSGFDPGDSVATSYQLSGTPTTVFIDSRGHRVGTVLGALTAPRLVWWLDQLGKGH